MAPPAGVAVTLSVAATVAAGGAPIGTVPTPTPMALGVEVVHVTAPPVTAITTAAITVWPMGPATVTKNSCQVP